MLDGRGEYAAAAEQLNLANSLMLANRGRRGQGYDPADHDREMVTVMKLFSPAYYERVRGFGSDSERPVFIFGLPRSGTTLTEQILAGHSRVFAAGELSLANAAWDSLPRIIAGCESVFEAVARLDRRGAETIARDYLDRLRLLDDQSLRITDKMPVNYMFLGLLATLFPQAKFIHCRRNLRDVAVSCWTTNFLDINWANDQEQIAFHFCTYLRLMEHWRRTLPVPILEVNYEQTVADLEGTARRLVDWCGLPWEPACLAFHERRRLVRTASMTQVREPIYQHAVGRWRNYERALAPLFSRLPN